MFPQVRLDALKIDDERPMRRVDFYARLKALLVRDGYRFRVAKNTRWERAVFLNLSFWSADDTADVVVDGRIPADVVAHVAWHHLARRALGTAASTVDGMLLGESIASAFDVYLVGRLLTERSSFVETQVEAMADASGMSQAAFRRLLHTLALDPSDAFTQLRSLLFDVSTSLVRAQGIDDANARLEAFSSRPYFQLLHHYNVSNWLLHSRAYGRVTPTVDKRIAKIDRVVTLDWLDREWLRPTERAPRSPRSRSQRA